MIDLRAGELRLRSLAPSDVDVLAAAAPFPDEAAVRWQELVDTAPTLADGGFLSLAAEWSGELVGNIQARAPRNGFPDGTCEIGMELFPLARGRGIAVPAVMAFTDHLLTQGWARVQASTSTENRSMRATLARAGYREEGILRSFAPDDTGGRDDYVMYAVTAGDRAAPAARGTSR